MSTSSQIRSYTYDSSQVLKAAGLVAASAASATILNVGDALFEGVAVVDVTAIEVATTDELYTLIIQGSTSPTFASDIENLVSLNLGASAARPGGAKTSTTGRYEIEFMNEQNGVTYPYIRIYTLVAGTIATGINYSAFVGRNYLC